MEIARRRPTGIVDQYVDGAGDAERLGTAGLGGDVARHRLHRHAGRGSTDLLRRRFQRLRAARGDGDVDALFRQRQRSEEHTSELQSLMRISYAVFCLKKKKTNKNTKDYT